MPNHPSASTKFEIQIESRKGQRTYLHSEAPVTFSAKYKKEECPDFPVRHAHRVRTGEEIASFWRIVEDQQAASLAAQLQDELRGVRFLTLVFDGEQFTNALRQAPNDQPLRRLYQSILARDRIRLTIDTCIQGQREYLRVDLQYRLQGI